MKAKFILMCLTIFMIGWLANSIVSPFLVWNVQQPLDFSLVLTPYDKAVPFDRVAEKEIQVYSDKIIIDVPEAMFAKYADTKSMLPVLSKDANGLEIKPKSIDDIQIGDIVSYNSKYFNGLIVHRVIDIREDTQGTYLILKGDNNPEPDPERVRFEQIHGVLIGVIY